MLHPNSLYNTDYSKLHYKLTKIYTVHKFAPIIHFPFLLERQNKESAPNEVLYTVNMYIIIHIS